MNSGTWTISLSQTTADWNTLSSTYASNIGLDNTLVFSGNLTQPWAFGDTLVINLTTPFAYDPSQGNLLMDVVVSGISMAGGKIGFDTNGYNAGNLNGNTFLGRVYYDGGGGTGFVDKGYGLVTGFDAGAPTTVPEPTSFVLVSLGLGALAAGIRRRRNV